ncbi:MAG: BatA domain-containing protein, partial [Gemmatimonadales bacterium]|nr:BatA domain-containing protein [Gemmatimonadales bacterium]
MSFTRPWLLLLLLALPLWWWLRRRRPPAAARYSDVSLAAAVSARRW